MELIIIAIATLSFIVYVFLLITANENITEAILTCKKETAIEEHKNLTAEINILVEKMQRKKEMDDKKSIKKGKALKKKIDEVQKRIEKYESGKLDFEDFLPIVGYRFIQFMKWDATNIYIKKMNAKCIQFKDKKEAINYSYYIIANLIGCIMLGAVVSIAALSILLSFGMGIKALIIALCIFVVIAIIGYLPYDNVNVVVNKRMEEIDDQFPQVASKLSLLTISGMEVNQAWKLTSCSGEGVLYEEMNKVIIDLNNNVPVADAYSKFMTKCNNNYTNKLGTAIIQNTSKGNSEIVELFVRLNNESWLERKHSSKRMGEKIQSKLLVPTLLMFVGILILIIVPVLSGFNFM